MRFADLLEVLDGLCRVFRFFLGAAEILHLLERLFCFLEDDVDFGLSLGRRGAQQHLQRDRRQLFHGLAKGSGRDGVGVCEELLDFAHLDDDVLVDLHLVLGPVLDQEDVLVQHFAQLFQLLDLDQVLLLLDFGLLRGGGLLATGLW